MKTVVFAGSYSVRCTMAAAFFDAFTLPTMVRAVTVSNGALEPPREVIEAMEEVGLQPVRARLHAPGSLDGAVLVVRFGQFPAPTVPGEWWDVVLPEHAVESVRAVRDQLRRRVWRLVAAQGWYKLQPAQAVGRRAPLAPV
jgi:hypothetical protein